MPGDDPRPDSLRRDGDDLVIQWSDGVRTRVTLKALRDACPCASCDEARKRPPDPFRVLTPRELEAGPPRPTAMPARGHYAYQVVWNDGHDTGIYSLRLLRQLGTPE